MKKISNNSSFGKLTQILNLLLLVFFILSMVFLLKFDKVNVNKVVEEPAYLAAKENLHTIEHPLKQNQAEVEYYAFKLDTLQKHLATADKKTAKTLKEDIDRTKNTLSEKEKALAETEAAIAEGKANFEPVETAYNNICDQTQKAFNTFLIVLIITLVCFIVKIVVWAIWNYKNSITLRNACSWMEKASHPAWAFAAWIIPVYHLIKPYTFFHEIYDETEYALQDKGIIEKNNSSDGDFRMGFWWGLNLISVIVMSVLLYATFFGYGPSFYKLNHTTMAIVAICFWAFYIAMEIIIINKYNKMNKLMAENESKFIA
ncbi:MAG: DUF4328 domain-containing protein [Bacteroidales bacterium]|nr:DUF4328 domain-containing protein [Bacteroidales bacterium]